MHSKYYNEAKKLDEDEGEYNLAIKVCDEGIHHSYFDCAYLKGLIYILNLGEDGIKDAIKSFEIGALNNNKECMYELAKIYIGKEYNKTSFINLQSALHWYFESYLIEMSDVKIICDAIKKVTKYYVKQTTENIINFIKNGDKWIKEYSGSEIFKTDKNILNTLKNQLNFLIEKELSDSKTIDELDKFFNIISMLDKNYFYDKALEGYIRKKTNLFIENKTSIEEIEKFFNSFCQNCNEESLPAKKILKNYIFNYYLKEKDISKIDLEKVRNFCIKTNDFYILNKFDLFLLEQINLLNSKKQFDLALNIVNSFIDKSLSSSTRSIINSKKEKAKFNDNLSKANCNDYEAMKMIAESYYYGKGTSENHCLAIQWLYNLVYLYKDKWAFDFLFTIYSNDEQELKKLLILGKNYKIVFNEKEKIEYDLLCISKKLLIFNLDGAIFDTDNLRIEKNKYSNYQISSLELFALKFVNGFENIFLKPDSPLYLGNCKVLIVTNNNEDYSNAILSSHEIISRFQTYPILNNACYKKTLSNFLKSHNNEYIDVYAFCSDEKDANVFSELELKFFIVNKASGYSLNVNEIIKLLDNKKGFFRNNYLYDKKIITNNNFCSNFYSKYIDDIVVYYKHYNVTNNNEDYSYYSKGSNNCPNQGKRKSLINFDQYEFGKKSKNQTIIRRLNYFASAFDDIDIDQNTVLTRPPSHDEIKYDSSKPMSKVISCIVDRHGSGINGCGILKRRYIVEESKTGDRSIYKHLKSIEIENVISIKGKTIYLIDDICTSGVSLIACTELLYRAGAGHVVCFCLARTCGDGKYAPVEIK